MSKSKAAAAPKQPPQPKVVLVTGANRGIGYGIIETLLEKQSKLRIVLTARDETLGQNAYNELAEKYPDEKEHFFFHQLDITKDESIDELITWIKTTFKKIDYLVNNAGVSSKGKKFDEEVFNFTFGTNVFGTINFTEKMISSDVLNKAGKIIFLGSLSGCLSRLNNELLISTFKNVKNSDDLFKLAEKFRNSIVNETIEEEGWCKNTFTVSKIIINTYAKVLGHRRDITKEQLSVYACNPGWVKTEMGGEHAELTIKEGAETPVFLIELPDGINKENQGKLFDKCKIASFE
jgi:carbonyl reductase 1/carbonyl reductase 3